MKGRAFQVEWKEDGETLRQRFQQERDRQRRTRLQALWQLRVGKRLGEVSQLVGVSYRTLQRWIAWYRQGGVDAVLRRVPGHGAPGRPAQLTAAQQEELKARADSGAFRTVHGAVAWMQQSWGVAYRYQGAYSLLRRLQIKCKVPRPQSEKASPAAQEAWKRGA